jgi:23S rRNA pseudouridine2604 synthase
MSDDGLRLSKRVMALAGCSRAQAERLIAQGDVTVDGQVQREPAHRVNETQAVVVREQAQAQGSHALTLLWHKPAGEAALTPESRGLRCAAPLPASASGLVVFTAHAGVWRAVAQAEPAPEQEWLIDLAGTQAANVLGPGVRASIGSQNPQQTRLRAVARGDWAPPARLQPLRQHRQRIGRVALGNLAEGATRSLLPHEKF